MNMTKDELTALRRERGKQELNIGDRVKVYDQDGNVMYDGKTAIIIEKALLDPTEFYYGLYVEGETVNKFRGKGLLYLKNTATKIGKTALLAPFYAEDLELVKNTLHEEIEAARQESLRLMKQAAQAQARFNETQYWQHYRAELVKEIAVKMADNNSITIPKICDYITDFATRIVDNLKKQSE